MRRRVENAMVVDVQCEYRLTVSDDRGIEIGNGIRIDSGCFFFFKQKTAYERLRGLVGSEMCIKASRNSPRRCQDPDLSLSKQDSQVYFLPVKG